MDNTNIDRKNNIILLIVIAIATLIIVVVGIVFSRLSEIVDKKVAAKNNASNDMFILNVGDYLSLNVDYNNIAKEQSDSTIASVTLSSGKDDITHRYDMYLNVNNNSFEYTSGKCYLNLGSEKREGIVKDVCLDNGGLWARSAYDDSYSCYTKDGISEIDLEGNNNNEVICNAYNDTLWAQEEVPELVLDIYEEDTSVKTSTACIGTEDNKKGACIKNNGSIGNEKNESDCIDGTWLENNYKAGKCFKPLKRIDITQSKANDNIEIFKDKEISSLKNEKKADYYLATVRMINLGHNEVVNSSKAFSGSLVLSVTDKNTPAK